MKYTVTYTELLGRTFIVDVDSEEDVRKKVLDAVENGFISLTANDYVMDSAEIADCWIASDVDENGVQHGNAYFVEREDMDWDTVMQKHDHGEEFDKIVNDAWRGEGTYTISVINVWVQHVECSDKKDLKHELHEFFEYFDCWNDRVIVTKVSDFVTLFLSM